MGNCKRVDLVEFYVGGFASNGANSWKTSWASKHHYIQTKLFAILYMLFTSFRSFVLIITKHGSLLNSIIIISAKYNENS